MPGRCVLLAPLGSNALGDALLILNDPPGKLAIRVEHRLEITPFTETEEAADGADALACLLDRGLLERVASDGELQRLVELADGHRELLEPVLGQVELVERAQVADGRGEHLDRVLVQVERLERGEQEHGRGQLDDLIRVQRDLTQRRHRADERRDAREPIPIEREGADVAKLAQRREGVRWAVDVILIHPQVDDRIQVAANGHRELLHRLGVAAEPVAGHVEQAQGCLPKAADDGCDAARAELVVLHIELLHRAVLTRDRANRVPRERPESPVGHVECRVGACGTAEHGHGQPRPVNLDRFEARMHARGPRDQRHALGADRIVRDVELLERLVILERELEEGGGRVVEARLGDDDVLERRVEPEHARQEHEHRVRHSYRVGHMIRLLDLDGAAACSRRRCGRRRLDGRLAILGGLELELLLAGRDLKGVAREEAEAAVALLHLQKRAEEGVDCICVRRRDVADVHRSERLVALDREGGVVPIEAHIAAQVQELEGAGRLLPPEYLFEHRARLLAKIVIGQQERRDLLVAHRLLGQTGREGGEQLGAGLVVELDVGQIDLAQRAHRGLAERLE